MAKSIRNGFGSEPIKLSREPKLKQETDVGMDTCKRNLGGSCEENSSKRATVECARK